MCCQQQKYTNTLWDTHVSLLDSLGDLTSFVQRNLFSQRSYVNMNCAFHAAVSPLLNIHIVLRNGVPSSHIDHNQVSRCHTSRHCKHRTTFRHGNSVCHNEVQPGSYSEYSAALIVCVDLWKCVSNTSVLRPGKNVSTNPCCERVHARRVDSASTKSCVSRK